MNQIQKRRKKKMICKYCGAEIPNKNRIMGTDMLMCPNCRMINLKINNRKRSEITRARKTKKKNK